MGAAWAYTDGSFAELDARIVALLRRGLPRGTARRILLAGRASPPLRQHRARAFAAAGCRVIDSEAESAAHLPGAPNSHADALRSTRRSGAMPA